MNKPKSIFIQKNKEFILVQTYLRGLISIVDPSQEFNYLSPNTSFETFGKVIKDKLLASRNIELEEFYLIFKSPEFNSLSERLEIEQQNLYGYKNRKSIYRNMDFLSIDMEEKRFVITPHHQDSLDGFTCVRDKEGNAIEFEYPLTLSDEELGAVTMKAFDYCTSIYRR
ncbi:contact-dependent growth inhibition system immunity protein [Lonepinella sp. MS14436]|uniref:contact-dependent growth inhibition system immunity protein n=1 Tax=Lonepinella sp. MS14436 TaxID=3003619 RepID=UPI0036DCA2FA